MDDKQRHDSKRLAYAEEMTNARLNLNQFRYFCISERELLCCRPSVCLSSVTLVHFTQAVVIFGNIFTAFGTLAIS